MKGYFFYIILLSTLLIGCQMEEKETGLLMTVEPETAWFVHSESQRPYECMQVKEMASGEVFYMGFYDIVGFRYEKGFKYLIMVKENEIDFLLSSASFVPYSIINIIEKTEIEDEGSIVLLNAKIGWINSDTPSRVYSCLLVKEENDNEWQRYPHIFGLNYEEGFEYLLKVKKNRIEPPLQTGEFYLNHAYWLIDIVSKLKTGNN